MLKLKNIIKDYSSGDTLVHALKGINITFNEKGIVGILGPSGCGKSTLLNIIGGLDQYTDGDLLINGRSTKTYTDKDWDAYRNHSIGFIFQSYNLIPHLTLIENVELALTIAGLTSKEKRKMSSDALRMVGLDGVENKKPNQLSGGQQQRVAIARALVNNPDIILADEPTGALDTETSIQVMEILKKIGKTKLVIMVTHNPDLAIKYSTRIIKMKDGLIVDDNAKIDLPDEKASIDDKKVPCMNFWTAIKLSFKNLISKKGRTLTTGIAGSIGIIGIGLILSLSYGTTSYMNDMLNDAVTTTPVTISSLSLSADTVSSIVSSTIKGEMFPDYSEGITPNVPKGSLFNTNHITQEYLDYVNVLENPESGLNYAVNVQESMGYNLKLFKKYEHTEKFKGNITLVDTNLRVYTQELAVDRPDRNEMSLIEQHYDNLAAGIPGSHMPTKPTELALIVDNHNVISTNVLDVLDIPYKDANGNLLKTLPYEDIIGKEYKLFLNDAYYKKDITGTYRANTDQTHIENVYNKEDKAKETLTLKITAVLRQKKSIVPSVILLPGLGYTSYLTDYLLSDYGNGKSQVVQAQLASSDKSVLTGLPYDLDPDLAKIQYENTLKTIGGTAVPSSIYIYAKDQASKDKIIEYLDAWNENPDNIAQQMTYNDSLAVTSSMLNQVMNVITIVLATFSGISLLVSSVMIGIITYVSVIERTKEIGVLRALGASKRNIREVFNAETVIIGFLAGLIGIGVTYLLQLCINGIFMAVMDIWGIAHLTILSAVGLIGVSTVLTCIAGLIPSNKAAKKDPVTCLRNE